MKYYLTNLLVAALMLQLSFGVLLAQSKVTRYQGAPLDVISLMGYDVVLKELGVSDEEAVKLKKVTSAANEVFSKAKSARPSKESAKSSNTKRSEKPGTRESIEAAFKKAHDTNLPKVKQILTPAQYLRAQQISWQTQGVDAFSDPELAKALNLTKEQQAKIAKAKKENNLQTKALYDAVTGNQIIDLEKKEQICTRSKSLRC